MSSYFYYQSDFKAATEINMQQLHDEIVALALTSTTFAGLEVASAGDSSASDFQCKVITSGSVLSDPEKVALDALINAYVYAAPKTDTMCVLKDVKSAGTNGGTLTADAWATRDLNTIVGDVDFCTLTSNQFTLAAGSYIINAKAPACDVQAHQIRLYNITDSSASMGSGNYATGGVITYSELNTVLTISSTSVFEIQHICSKTTANIGLGRANGWGEEVYTSVIISTV